MIIQNKRIFASILFVLISFVCAAQGPPIPGPPPPVGLVPIDGGLLVSVFIALVYGGKKLLQSKK